MKTIIYAVLILSVLIGPFAGMIYAADTSASGKDPLLVGVVLDAIQNASKVDSDKAISSSENAKKSTLAVPAAGDTASSDDCVPAVLSVKKEKVQ